MKNLVFNNDPVTPAQRERLQILIEECSEVIKAASKILRHGYESDGYNNRGDLITEIGDVVTICDHMDSQGDIVFCNHVDGDLVSAMSSTTRRNKMLKMLSYCHHQNKPA